MNDLDELMSRDPIDLTKDDIDRIIDYHRQQRARRAAGEKPKRPKAAESTVDVSDVLKNLIQKSKPEVVINRRKL